ncbi:MAG: hypothetical protein RID07_11165, partial [Lacipirellulaceae bacterium]
KGARRLSCRNSLQCTTASGHCFSALMIIGSLAVGIILLSNGDVCLALCIVVGAFCVAGMGIFTMLAMVLLFVAVLLFVTALRVMVTIATSLRHPIQAICAIPLNWKRVALCDSAAVIPELLPGLREHRVLHGRLSATALTDLFWAQRSHYFPESDELKQLREHGMTFDEGDVFLLVGLPVTVVCLYVPALLYRFSLKSTSYLYVLLLGIIGVLYGKYRVFGEAPAKERLALASQDRVSLVFGLITFGSVIVLPIGVIALVRTVRAGLPAIPERFAFIVDFFTVHPTIGWWNLMQLANAALAVLTLPVARLAVRRPRFMGVADHSVRLMVFTRGVLTVGLILWFLAVVWYRVGWDGLTEFFGAVIETIRGIEFNPSLPGPPPSEPVA